MTENHTPHDSPTHAGESQQPVAASSLNNEEVTPRPKPVLTKAIGSMLCGLASIPSCFCLGVPSILLGAAAIWLGRYVHKNFRDSTASEVANVYAWIGVGLGVIGVVLGIIGVIMYGIPMILSVIDAVYQATQTTSTSQP